MSNISAIPTPLDLNTLQPINVVPFLISSKILRILRGRGRIQSLSLGNLHALGLCARLVAELHQSDQHGQPETAHQYVEDPRNITQAEGASLLLQGVEGRRSKLREKGMTERQTSHYYVYQINYKFKCNSNNCEYLKNITKSTEKSKARYVCTCNCVSVNHTQYTDG